MKWSQFIRLLDAMGFPRARSVRWSDWAWRHFDEHFTHRLSAEQVILAVGYIMQGKKREAVREIETSFPPAERP